MSNDQLFPIIDSENKIGVSEKQVPKKGTPDIRSETAKLKNQANLTEKKKQTAQKRKFYTVLFGIFTVLLILLMILLYVLTSGSTYQEIEIANIDTKPMSVSTDNIQNHKQSFRVNFSPLIKNSMESKNIFDDAYDMVIEELENAGFSEVSTGKAYFIVELKPVGISNTKVVSNSITYPYNYAISFKAGESLDFGQPSLFDSLADDDTAILPEIVHTINIPHDQIDFEDDGKIRKATIKEDYKIVVQKKIYGGIKPEMEKFISSLK